MKRPELWLSYAYNPSFGCFVAIASSKHPDLGDDEVDVIAHSFEKDEARCKAWFDALKKSWSMVS